MKNLIKGVFGLVLILFISGAVLLPVQAKGRNVIPAGLYINNISLEGKTVDEAASMINEFVAQAKTKTITLQISDEHTVTITPEEVGFCWSNPEILTEMTNVAQKGNIVNRYKARKDMEFSGKTYAVTFGVDRDKIWAILDKRCTAYDVSARNATLSRENGEFVIHQGTTGVVLDKEASLEAIAGFFTDGSWNGEDGSVALVAAVDEPHGSAEDLNRVKDVLGSFTTSYKTSGKSRSANVENGCRLINGTTLFPGEEFSALDTITPFTQENGYFLAGSYLNGQVVDSFGGGICQVSTTLYNAVLLAELEVTERHNHSMIVTYVDPSADAAIAESAGKNFKFVNNTSAPIYIEGYTTEDKQIGFVIYGEETRSSTHSVKYVSEVTSKTTPDTEVIYTDAGSPIGSVSVQSAHIGYKANLYKVTYENGEEVSREMVNSSSYKAAPRSATVGVATDDINAYNEIMAAVSTNNIDHVKNVAAALKAGTAVPATPEAAVTEEAPAAPVVETPPEEAPAEE